MRRTKRMLTDAQWRQIAPHLPDHLTYLNDLEARGRVFASGPFPAADGTPDGRGMTVLRAGSLQHPIEYRKTRAGAPEFVAIGDARFSEHDLRSRAIVSVADRSRHREPRGGGDRR